MTPTNLALWPKAKQDSNMVVEEAAYPSAELDGMVVETEAVAIIGWGSAVPMS